VIFPFLPSDQANLLFRASIYLLNAPK